MAHVVHSRKKTTLRVCDPSVINACVLYEHHTYRVTIFDATGRLSFFSF